MVNPLGRHRRERGSNPSRIPVGAIVARVRTIMLQMPRMFQTLTRELPQLFGGRLVVRKEHLAL